MTLKLCYIDSVWAYFTTKDLDKQWGDDWNDAPYEHNAGAPYEEQPYEIVKVAFEAPMETPAELANLNSRYSVESINKGHIPWLTPSRYGAPDEVKPIYAGTDLPNFIDLIRKAGGTVYHPLDEKQIGLISWMYNFSIVEMVSQPDKYNARDQELLWEAVMRRFPAYVDQITSLPKLEE